MPVKYAIEEWCEAFLDIFCDDKDLYYDLDAETMNEEFFVHFRKGDDFETAGIIENWTALYMDNLELLRGSGETVTMMSLEDMNREYIRCFQGGWDEFEQAVKNYCRYYLELYGPAEISEMNMNAGEMNEELFRVFRTADGLDAAMLADDWSDIYMEVFEQLYGTVEVSTVMNVEEMNKELIRYFRKDEEVKLLLERAA